MYILPVILFCSGVILGGVHGYFLGHTAMDLLFSIAVGGFLGSAVGSGVFIFIYAFRREPEEMEPGGAGEQPDSRPRRIHIPMPPKQLPPLVPPRVGSADTAPPFPPHAPVAEAKARKIQRLEEELNALKQKKRKGN